MSQHKKRIRIVVPDPALCELGGHHPATLESLIACYNDVENVSIEVYGSLKCNQNYIERLQNERVTICRVFETDFYFGFYQNLGFRDLQGYIRKLALEYANVLSEYKNVDSGEVVVFWFYTLGWQHAEALSLALKITKLEFGNNTLCKVLLMYSAKRQARSERDLYLKQLWFGMTFSRLWEHTGVSLYAADAELADEYEGMLGRKLPIHPCILLGNCRRLTLDIGKAHNGNKKIVLYLGDAKEEKGFAELPALVSAVLSDSLLSDYSFLVQYSLTNEKSSLVAVDSELSKLALENPRLERVARYIDHNEMQKLFLESTAVVFNYSEKIYANQSSGVFWLAAYYSLVVITLTQTWINREAARVGVLCRQVSKKQIGQSLVGLGASAESPIVIESNNTYREDLFRELGDWFSREIEKGLQP